MPISKEEMLEQIKNQIGSDGRKGWPVFVRDRVAYPPKTDDIVTNANVAVVFCWTIRDDIVPHLEKNNLAVATNFYTPAGLEGMCRNVLSNPFIRYIILLGNEYSVSRDNPGFTSANALRTFFEKGLNEKRKVPGFETSINFDKNIPTDLIEKIRQNVQLIDLNKEMPTSTLKEKTEKANNLIKTLEKKEPFLEQPHSFGYEKVEEPFPYEGGPLIVRGNTIPNTWIEIMHNIFRHGRDNLMDANTDRWVKEINNLVAVIHNPQSLDLSVNPFLVPMTKEKIDAYVKEVLSPELPEGKAYTYGNKLRAYFHSNLNEVKELVNSSGFKDFEFGKGPHLDQNVKYTDNGCEIDQIQDMVDALHRNLYSKSAVAITWHVQDELMRKHKSSPCMVLLQAIVQDEKLNLAVFFRSHDMVQGWPENAYGCAAIQKHIADGLKIDTGILTIISGSAQIYKTYYKQVEEMLNKHRKYRISHDDPRATFLIDLKDGKIVVTHLNPKTNKELDKFEGTIASEIIRKISEKTDLQTSHAMDIGSELQKAEIALKMGLVYTQDRPLVFGNKE